MPKRSLFISFHSADVQKARGFNLLQYSKNVDANFSSRHLLSPVDSQNDDYVWRKISEQMTGTSATVVLLGEKTYDREWVAREIEKTVQDGKGVLAMRLKDVDAPLPPDSRVGKALDEAGAEVLDWNPDAIEDAVERAINQERRCIQIAQAAPAPGTCSR